MNVFHAARQDLDLLPAHEQVASPCSTPRSRLEVWDHARRSSSHLLATTPPKAKIDKSSPSPGLAPPAAQRAADSYALSISTI